MTKKNFTEEQIVHALRQAEAGTAVTEICRKMGVTEQSFYRWKRKFSGLGITELRRLKQLEEENKGIYILDTPSPKVLALALPTASYLLGNKVLGKQKVRRKYADASSI